ncbi:MAG TPA: acylphosphatase [Candidatus Omnitrophota bacterium]|nr:acylphosphatase [Candidatus Omnitrophota bacterium]
MILIHVFYKGIVQGVGFRYTTQRIAKNAGLCGWVRNCPDGRVELKAEGPKEAVEQFMSQLEQHFCGNIRDKEIYYENHLERFENFNITF